MQRLLPVKVIVTLFTAGGVMAEEWVPMTGPEIQTALSNKSLEYIGASQSFYADGTTTYVSGRPSSGGWKVQGDQYCSVWPPVEQWSCYAIEKDQDSGQFRFVDADGRLTVGWYPE